MLFGDNDNTRIKSRNSVLHAPACILPSHTNRACTCPLQLLSPQLHSFPVPRTSTMRWVHNASAQVDRDSKYPMFICVCVIMNSTMIAAVSLRAYIRIRSGRIGWDDWFTFVAAVRLTILDTFYHVLTRIGSYCCLHSRCSISDASWAGITTCAAPVRWSSCFHTGIVPIFLLGSLLTWVH